MDYIKHQLKENYNKSVNLFNEGNYKDFFMYIRLVLEYLPQLVIHDLLVDENKANRLINGEICFSGNRIDEYNRATPKPSGAHFAVLMKKSFALRYPILFDNSIKDQDDKRKRTIIESAEANFRSQYSKASDYHHSARTNNDLYLLALNCATFIKTFIDDMQKYNLLSHDTVFFLLSLDDFKFSSLNQQAEDSLLNEREEKKMLKEQLKRKDAEIEAYKAQVEKEKKEKQIVISEKENIKEELNITKEYNRQIEIKAEDWKASVIDLKKKLAETSNIKEEKPIVRESVNTVTADTASIKKVTRFQESKLNRALELTLQDKSATEIIKVTHWKPVNTYERLCKLVEAGCIPAGRFVPNENIKVINDSIQQVGSKAEKHIIQDNCSKKVPLWQVSMVLAELKFKNIIIEPEPDDKAQDEFMDYIRSCFRIEKHKCFKQIPSDLSKNEPDLVIELSAYKKKKVFAISSFFNGTKESFNFSWEYLKSFRLYDKKISGRSYFIIGYRGTPKNPEKLYILPLSIFKKDTAVYLKDLKKYCIKAIKGEFRYDISDDSLELVSI